MAVTRLVGSTQFIDMPIYGTNVSAMHASNFEVAITMRRPPIPSDWKPVTVYENSVVRYLVGPESTHGPLELGDNTVYLRITAAPEKPIITAGVVKIVDR